MICLRQGEIQMVRSYKYYRETTRYTRAVNYNGFVENEYDGGDGYEFDYTPDADDLKEALIDIVANYYFEDAIKNPETEKKVRQQIEELLEDEYTEEALLDSFDNELKEYFEEDAMASEGDE